MFRNNLHAWKTFRLKHVQPGSGQESMHKVSLITRHSIRNYGSVLQAFATQELFEAAGSAPTFIDYRQPQIDDTAGSYRPKEPGAKGIIKSLAYSALRSRGAYKRGQLFETFIRANLHLSPTISSTDHELKKAALESSARNFCVGSDQVWNIEYNVNNSPYYLDFAPKGAKKFSFSSSIGMELLPPHEEVKLVAALESFSGISVRESGAVEYLQSLGLSVEHHLDPTMVISRSRWDEFAQAITVRTEPYVLAYQLNASPALQKAAVDVARSLGLPLVRIEYWQTFRGSGAQSIIRPRVEEFVALFRDAAFVITDSFHGTAFSIIHEKQFVALMPPRYGGRIFSVLDQLGLAHRQASDSNKAVHLASDLEPYESVRIHLQQQRSRAIAYIRSQVEF